MFRARATRLATRVPLAAILMLAVATPALATHPTVIVDATSSPASVTVRLPVAYPVTVTNPGRSTLNHLKLEGKTSVPMTYLGAEPAQACSQTVPICALPQLKKGKSVTATFYFAAPATAGTITFNAVVTINGGGGSHRGGGHSQTFVDSVQTTILAPNPDLVSGHSTPRLRSFSTGLTNLDEDNQHGTTALLSTNTSVTLEDVPPGEIDLDCPYAIADDCFGSGSSLSIGNGASFPKGIKVTVRWDASELPSEDGYPSVSAYSHDHDDDDFGADDLDLVHLFDGGGYELIEDACSFHHGVPTNMPCLAGGPIELRDGDIQASMFLEHNGLVRGW